MRKKQILNVPMLTTFAALAALFLAACAGTPPPTEKISNVEMMIQRARQNEADKYAPLELRLAEEKLKEARSAMDEDENEEAHKKADQALADARLAEAKARAEKARRLSDEMSESVDNLRQEIERK